MTNIRTRLADLMSKHGMILGSRARVKNVYEFADVLLAQAEIAIIELPSFQPGSGACPSRKVWYSVGGHGKPKSVGVHYRNGYQMYTSGEARTLAAELLAAATAIDKLDIDDGSSSATG